MFTGIGIIPFFKLFVHIETGFFKLVVEELSAVNFRQAVISFGVVNFIVTRAVKAVHGVVSSYAVQADLSSRNKRQSVFFVFKKNGAFRLSDTGNLSVAVERIFYRRIPGFVTNGFFTRAYDYVRRLIFKYERSKQIRYVIVSK